MEVGEIYYLSSQFETTFIKILKVGKIWDPNNEWVYYAKDKYINIQNEYNTGQMKLSSFKHLLNNYTFNSKFKGLIKVDEKIINSITYINNPFFDDNLLVKKLSKNDFRNFQINKIYEDASTE